MHWVPRSNADLDAYKRQSEAKMQAFDRLPLIVRRTLAASQFNWNVEGLLQTWREKRMTAWQMVRYVQNEDRWRLESRRHDP